VPLKPRPTAFRTDDSDEDDDNAASDIARVNAQLAKRRAADEAALLAAANEDPSIYDYDGSYDTFKAEKVSTHQLSQPSVSKDPPVSRNPAWCHLLFTLPFLLLLRHLIRNHAT
jgi:hypothetical protein